jgi:hypothetical protein
MPQDITTNTTSAQQDIVLYQSKDGEVKFHVNVFNKTVWLTQKQMAVLFARDRKTITGHISNVFKEKELNKESVCLEYEHTAADGKKYKTKGYNLDVVISVGYRVKSQRGTQFRQWATNVLQQYMLQGYSLNETRLSNIEENLQSLIDANQYNQQLTAERISNIEQDLDTIKTLLLKAADRPINISINNNNQIASPKLEDKLLDLIDEVINSIKSDAVKHQLADIKQDIQAATTSASAKQRVSNFFTAIGDTHSTTHKAIKGAGIAKGIITELIKLGSKIKDLV